MNDPAPSRGFPAILAGLIGLVVGGVAAGSILGFLLVRQQARHEAELAAVNAGTQPIKDLRDGIAVFNPPKPNEADPEERQVTKFGTEFVEDLENNRLASAYRVMSTEYQKKTERAMFDEMVTSLPGLRTIGDYDRKPKTRKLQDGKWDFYFTGTERNTFKKVNVTLTVARMKEDWRVEELEILTEGNPKK
jgi:hypothetical protein